MYLKISVLVFLVLWNVLDVIADATDFNNVNNDGSFSFGLKNSDYGNHYHTATGTRNNVVTGRHGSRNPGNHRIEEIKYTAGPRGFRPQGPNIQRKFDQSQVPRGPIGSIKDPLADPYEDPSYEFGFRLKDQRRQENANRLGQVNGLYSYVDDVGEKHAVRYAAGAGTGFEVLNAVPDSPASVQYNSPLYKVPSPTARGKIAFESGPNGQYKFISSAPDQRRSETTGPDGVTRGSYSYLDDKNVQRTVEYIAGAGIGYKVLKSTEGVGTHILSRPVLSDYEITPDDYYQSLQNVSPAPSYSPNLPRPIPTEFGNFAQNAPNFVQPSAPPPAPSSFAVGPSSSGVGPLSTGFENNLSSNNQHSGQPYKVPLTSGFSGTGPSGPSGSGSYEHSSNELNNIPGLLPPHDYSGSSSSDSSASRESDNYHNNQNSNGDSKEHRLAPQPFLPTVSNLNEYRTHAATPTKPYALAYGDKTHYSQPNQVHKNSHEPRIIGKWYPVPSHDAQVRAHIQNIGVVSHRAPSPSEALRRDEENSGDYH